MLEDFVRPEIRALEAYVPGRSIEEIRQEYGIEKVIKMASNENPLGTSPLVQEVLARHAGEAFRYPAGGNPRLVKAIARYLGLPESRIAVGNGSDEIIDMIIRIMTTPAGTISSVSSRASLSIRFRVSSTELRSDASLCLPISSSTLTSCTPMSTKTRVSFS